MRSEVTLADSTAFFPPRAFLGDIFPYSIDGSTMNPVYSLMRSGDSSSIEEFINRYDIYMNPVFRICSAYNVLATPDVLRRLQKGIGYFRQRDDFWNKDKGPKSTWKMVNDWRRVAVGNLKALRSIFWQEGRTIDAQQLSPEYFKGTELTDDDIEILSVLTKLASDQGRTTWWTYNHRILDGLTHLRSRGDFRHGYLQIVGVDPIGRLWRYVETERYRTSVRS